MIKKLFDLIRLKIDNGDGSIKVPKLLFKLISFIFKLFKIEHRIISEIPITVYSPQNNSSSLPAIIYYHGGGFVFGIIENYHSFIYMLAKELNVVLIYIKYVAWICI
jgi:dipeptidyl aminopeptidase/acylaminoacyl peptidase